MVKSFEKPAAEMAPTQEKDYRVIVPPPCATDDEILQGCDANVFDWEYSSTAELGTPLDQLSPEAKEARGVAAILLQRNKTGEAHDPARERSAREEYRRLSEAFKENSERKILYLGERLQRLVDQGVIDEEERDVCLQERVTPRVRALLWGLPLDDARAFGKLSAMTRAELAGGDREKRLDGFRMELQKRRGLSEPASARLENLAARMGNLNKEENIERKALINLRGVLSGAKNMEVQLALRDFTFDKLYRYIYLSTKEEESMLRAHRIARGSFSTTPEGVARIQRSVDAAYEASSLAGTEADERDVLLAEIEREPLLKYLRSPSNWKDTILYGGLGG